LASNVHKESKFAGIADPVSKTGGTCQTGVRVGTAALLHPSNTQMPKIVINTCYGGFSLSPKAVARIAELKGRKCFFFRNRDEDGEFDLQSYEKITPEQAAEDLFWVAFDIDPPPPCGDWDKMSEFDRTAENEAYERHSLEHRDIKRDDPLLIRVVEELGEEANGSCASLKIIEVPDDVKWEIAEYDGSERVAECHRTWS
jgi:hypothetical protein